MTAKEMSDDDKFCLLAGCDSWHTSDLDGKLYSVSMTDGPHGVSSGKGTVMPSLTVVANSFDTDTAYLQAATIADDCIDGGNDILLAPGVNIKRTPLGGRNFEYFSEDPLLAGEMGKAFIAGVQDKGVGACLKHFAANNSETERYFQSSDVDERTLREIYLKPFEIALAAKPWSVMCSYNPVNGIFASENRWLLYDILRKTFGYDGAVISDWDATRCPYKAVKAGCDLTMGSSDEPIFANFSSLLKEAYEKGRVTREEIDFCVANVMTLIKKAQTAKRQKQYSREERHKNAVTVAREGIVLLKNDGVLPLKTGMYAVGGTDGEVPTQSGHGSAGVIGEYKQKRLDELIADINGSAVLYRPLWGAFSSKKDYAAFARRAYAADAVILCVSGETDGESRDRTSIKLKPMEEEAILRTCEWCDRVVVCVYSGSCIDMSAWIDKVSAVVYVGYAGEGGNEALAEILTGKTNPSGKLAETFPLSLSDAVGGLDKPNGFSERYNEGIFVGYRGYDTFKKDVLFPFGHGLSYSEFVYSDLKIEKKTETDYKVSFCLTNNSDTDGKEVSQLYVRDVFSMVPRPVKELKGFAKTALKAHESKCVEMTLDKSAFAYYSVPLRDWYAENGDFEILVGASSRDIRLSGKMRLQLPEEEQYTQD